MPWDRKRLLGYVETIQLILGVTDKAKYKPPVSRVTQPYLNLLVQPNFFQVF